MSENLDLVRSIYADCERGDYGSLEWAHPDIEFVFADGPSPEGWVGVAEMEAGWREFLKAWGSHRAEPEEFRELDDERVLVLVLVRAIAQDRTSGLDAAARGVHLFHVRAGMITKLVLYWDRDRALTDLGLEE